MPPGELDPFLDAAARCFARHGVIHTAVADVALEMGVSRTTVYRQVGTVEQLGRLLLAREIHRLLLALPTQLSEAGPVDAVIEAVAFVVRFARQHPVLRKVLEAEPELAGSYLAIGLPAVLERAVPVIKALLANGVASGGLAPRDLDALADWLVRLVSSLVLAPPRGGLEDYLDQVIRPVLTPVSSSSGPSRTAASGAPSAGGTAS